MKLSENYNSAKAKYGEIADRMRAARISDGFLLSACRFNQENGVPPEDLFNYFHQWCIYVLRHKRIDVNTLDFSGFYSTIQEYKNKYGIPNQTYIKICDFYARLIKKTRPPTIFVNKRSRLPALGA